MKFKKILLIFILSVCLSLTGCNKPVEDQTNIHEILDTTEMKLFKLAVAQDESDNNSILVKVHSTPSGLKSFEWGMEWTSSVPDDTYVSDFLKMEISDDTTSVIITFKQIYTVPVKLICKSKLHNNLEATAILDCYKRTTSFTTSLMLSDDSFITEKTLNEVNSFDFSKVNNLYNKIFVNNSLSFEDITMIAQRSGTVDTLLVESYNLFLSDELKSLILAKGFSLKNDSVVINPDLTKSTILDQLKSLIEFNDNDTENLVKILAETDYWFDLEVIALDMLEHEDASFDLISNLIKSYELKGFDIEVVNATLNLSQNKIIF